ncbi:sigma-70 family RNA polymerase sigma factor [bacterium]|nr:MAG: sigma-70 family RNA polymerase sigma factor [bacterium]
MTTYSHLTEIQVIDIIINGDKAAFEVLVRKYNPMLYNIGRAYGYNHQDVEDLMQCTFINAYKSLSKLKDKAFFKTWLTRIMLNECYRNHNKPVLKKSFEVNGLLYEKDIPAYLNSTNSGTEKEVANRELNSVVKKAINEIPLDYRLVFSLRELNGMNVSETARALNITETNVKVRLNRAKAMLRKEIQKTYSVAEIFEFNLIYCDKVVSRIIEGINE